MLASGVYAEQRAIDLQTEVNRLKDELKELQSKVWYEQAKTKDIDENMQRLAPVTRQRSDEGGVEVFYATPNGQQVVIGKLSRLQLMTGTAESERLFIEDVSFRYWRDILAIAAERFGKDEGGGNTT